ncbi:thioesterase domain-containing protein [Acetobacter senegalensis]|uniref:thioesterase domain-containing protein n=1 Tax=Acetobacter senegalensis TaxID=446692 RepID=UPI0038D14A55
MGVTDNFFEVGGDSILAMHIVFLAQKICSLENYSLAHIYEYSNVESGVENIVKSKNNFLYSLNSIDYSLEKKYMFCIHPAYGLSASYALLSKIFSQFFNVYGVDSPIFHGSELESLSPAEIFSVYASAIKEKLNDQNECTLVGWSLGCIYIKGIIEQLEYLGISVGKVIFLDPYIKNDKYHSNVNIVSKRIIYEARKLIYKEFNKISDSSIENYLRSINDTNNRIIKFTDMSYLYCATHIIISETYNLTNIFPYINSPSFYSFPSTTHETLVHDERLKFLFID